MTVENAAKPAAPRIPAFTPALNPIIPPVTPPAYVPFCQSDLPRLCRKIQINKPSIPVLPYILNDKRSLKFN